MVGPWSDMIVMDGRGEFFRREVIPERWRHVMEMRRVPFGISKEQERADADDLDKWWKRMARAQSATVYVEIDPEKSEYVEALREEISDWGIAQWDLDHKLTKPHKEVNFDR